MLSLTQIIVGTPNHDRAFFSVRKPKPRVRKAALIATDIGEDAIAPFFADAFQRGGEDVNVLVSHRPRGPLASSRGERGFYGMGEEKRENRPSPSWWIMPVRVETI
jgi:hypothetical protein